MQVLNGRFHALGLGAAVEHAVEAIQRGERGIFSTVNVAILMMMRSDPALQRFVERSALVVADGQPIVWASRLLGRPLPERVAGVELVEALCAAAAREGLGIYLLGARREVVREVARQLGQRYPELRICGSDDGYFPDAEAAGRARRVAESGAHILFAAMGVPRQESFIEEHWDELGVGLALGVGGSFDVLVGLRRRAPRALQRLGLEWLFRLAQEPRRLWKRYLVTNTRFLWLVGRELLTPSRRRVEEGLEGL